AAIIVNLHVEIAIGDAPHGVAEEPEAPGNAASNVKPGDQDRADHRSDRKDGQNKLSRPDLVACITGDRLRNAPLLIDEIVDGLLEFRGLGLYGNEGQHGLMLLIEFVGTRGNDSVFGSDRAKLLVKGKELRLLGAVADRIQILGNLSLSRVDKFADWLQT